MGVLVGALLASLVVVPPARAQTSTTASIELTSVDSERCFELQDACPEGDHFSVENSFEFTITLDPPASGGETVAWQIVPGGAEHPADAHDVLAGNAGGSVDFAVDETSAAVTVVVRGDTEVEPDETLTVAITSDDVEISATEGQASGMILTDEPVVRVEPVQDDPDAPVEVTEGTTFAFEVSLTAAGEPTTPAVPITIPFEIAGDEGSEHSIDAADPSSDLVAVDGTGKELSAYELTIPTSATSGLIRLKAINDGIGEPRREGFTLTLAPDGDVDDAILATSPDPLVVTGAVVDVQPHLSIESDVDVFEADGFDVTGEILVSIDRAPPADVQVAFASTSDSNDPNFGPDAKRADPNQDYEAVSGTLTFPEGDASPRAIGVTVAGDTEAEGAEFFAVVLSGAPESVYVDEPVGFVRIVDNEMPTLSVADVEMEEGDPGEQRTMDFVIEVAPASADPIRLTYATADGSVQDSTAPKADDASSEQDYVQVTATTGIVDIPSGVGAVSAAVEVNGDEKHEADEWLTVTVKDEDGAGDYVVQARDRSTFAPSSSASVKPEGVILNDDPIPTILMDDFAGREGDFDRPFELGVRLSNPSDGCTEVEVFTDEHGTANKQDTDFVPITPDFIRFEPGEITPNQGSPSPSNCRGINAYVQVQGDLVPEPNETFHVVLTSPACQDDPPAHCDVRLPDRALHHTATFTILNDDGPHLKIDDPRVAEGDGEAGFTVTVAQPGPDPITVEYATEDVSAVAGTDYTATSGTLTIPGDTASATVSVPILDNEEVEPDRGFLLRLSNANGATIFDGLGTALIEDDDDPGRPVADAGAPVTVMEGDEASFDGSGSADPDGSITLYTWDFGDGSLPVSGISPTATHTFARTGVYTVTLTVTDDEGKTDTDVTTATVTNAPPTVELTGDTSVEVQTPASFVVTGSDAGGGPFLVTWDFGDGSGSDDNVTGIAHAYAATGTYTVTVTVADGDGGEATDTWEVTVTPDVGEVNRVWGDDRKWTALWVSRLFWPDGGASSAPSSTRQPAAETTTPGAPHAVLATSQDFPDALAGGALAALLDAPILLNPQEALDLDIAGELERRGVQTVWLLGGGAALSKAVSDELTERGYDVARFNGEDRFHTAALIAESVGVNTQGEVVVALGRHAEPSRDAWPDALSAGALAAVPDALPVLLTRSDTLPEATAQALQDLVATKAYVVGGEAAIAPQVADQLAELGIQVTRLAGEDRYGTSAAVATEAVARHPAEGLLPAVFARGTAFPDGLPAGALAARQGGLLVLVPTDDLTRAPAVEAFLGQHAHRVDEGVVVGGAAAVSDHVLAQLTDAIRAP